VAELHATLTTRKKIPMASPFFKFETLVLALATSTGEEQLTEA
jgi:hypothetical protein